jgi:hypothetical protein
MEAIRRFLERYIRENKEDLLAFDLKLARLLGAPSPHTISSYSHIQWVWFEPIVNATWWWLFKEKDHCRQDYLRVIQS